MLPPWLWSWSRSMNLLGLGLKPRAASRSFSRRRCCSCSHARRATSSWSSSSSLRPSDGPEHTRRVQSSVQFNTYTKILLDTHTHISVTPRPLISFSPTLLSSVHLSLRHIPLSTSGSRRCHLPALTQLCPEHPSACALPSSPTLTATIFSHVTPICLSYPLSHTDRTFW